MGALGITAAAASGVVGVTTGTNSGVGVGALGSTATGVGDAVWIVSGEGAGEAVATFFCALGLLYSKYAILPATTTANKMAEIITDVLCSITWQSTPARLVLSRAFFKTFTYGMDPGQISGPDASAGSAQGLSVAKKRPEASTHQ